MTLLMCIKHKIIKQKSIVADEREKEAVANIKYLSVIFSSFFSQKKRLKVNINC